jgi:hypothetical protein
MTALQKLQLKQSEIREKINGLLGNDARTEDETAALEKLTGEGQGLEVELRAAIIAAPDPQESTTTAVDPEVRERLELRGRASFGRYLHAALTGAQISGAEAEFQAACKTPGIPLDLFEIDRPPEVRADAATGVPSTGTGATLAPIQPFVFSQSIAPMLGIVGFDDVEVRVPEVSA